MYEFAKAFVKMWNKEYEKRVRKWFMSTNVVLDAEGNVDLNTKKLVL